MKKLNIIAFEGIKYGFWDDEIKAVRTDLAIHRLPQSSPFLAGIATVDEKLMSIADLAVCMGHPAKASGVGAVILLSVDGQSAGFATSSNIWQIDLSEERIYPIPECAGTELVNVCAADGAELIPVINMAELYRRVQKDDFEPYTLQVEFEQITTESRPEKKVLRQVVCNGETLALCAVGLMAEIDASSHMAKFGQMPEYIAGLVLSSREVVPIIHLAKRLHMGDEGGAKRILLAQIKEQKVGFIIDAVADDPIEDGQSVPLPPIVSKTWMKDAILSEGEIVPVIDLEALVLSRFDGRDEAPLVNRYTPETVFRAGVEPCEIVAFSVLGVRHAIPKKEYVDSFDITYVKPVPDTSPMILGIAEYEGVVLPVLDLALCYGERSSITADWRMILVKNGDFSAFVLTEEVYGIEKLEVEQQKDLPVWQPHQFAYGCYTGNVSGAVFLILNIENITVHFDAKAIGDVLKTFSSAAMRPARKMAADPASINETVLSKNLNNQLADVCKEEVTGDEIVEDGAAFSEEVASDVSAENEIKTEALIADETLNGQSAGAEASIEGESVEPEDIEEEGRVESDAPDVQGVPGFSEDSDREEPEEPDEYESEPAQADNIAVDTVDMEDSEPAEEEKITLEDSEDEVGAAVPFVGITSDEGAEDETVAEPEDIEGAEISAADDVEKVEEKETSPDEYIEASGETDKTDQEKQTVDETGEAAGKQAVPGVGSSTDKNEEEPIQEENRFAAATVALDQESEVQGGQLDTESRAVEIRPQEPSQSRKKVAWFVAAIIFILVLIYLLLPFKQKDQKDVERPLVATSGEKSGLDQPESKAPVKPAEPSTLDDVPAPESGFVEYTVQAGDSLFRITQGYTGDGWQYPTVAQENNIPDADLIYPDQVIKIPENLVQHSGRIRTGD